MSIYLRVQLITNRVVKIKFVITLYMNVQFCLVELYNSSVLDIQCILVTYHHFIETSNMCTDLSLYGLIILPIKGVISCEILHRTY